MPSVAFVALKPVGSSGCSKESNRSFLTICADRLKENSTCSNKGRFHQIKFRHHGMRILIELIQMFGTEIREADMILKKAQAKMSIACTGFKRQTEKFLIIY